MKQPRLWTLISSVGVLLVFVASLALGGVPEKDRGAKLQKTETNDLYRPFLINNVFNYYSNNGDGSYNKFSTDNEGFEFYIGSGKHVIYEDGVVWGGFHNGQLKVGGSVYRHGLQAGPIVSQGQAATASDAKYRVYRVRPDVGPSQTFEQAQGKLALEVDLIGRYESYSAQDLYNQYVADWNDWPADEGAPFTDVDSNGVYDPKVDIPGVRGADQTLWYVSNDLSAARVANLSGSLPIGLEMQRTIWGYKRSGALGNTIFMSSILINKSGSPVDSMYLVQWTDPDLGDAGDDYAGCDTTRSLGFIYNAPGADATYGVAVPSGGFDFFQGPLVKAAATDTAIFKLKYRSGFKNLPMTAFVFFTQGNATFADPRQGTGGDVDWYRLMNGRVASNGNEFIDPTTGKATKFTLYGDPVAGTGWLDGTGGLTKGDRRFCMVTGPFTMAAGDTQEIVVANLAGLGADRLSSVSVMKSVDDKAQQAYNSLFVLPAPPPAPNVVATPLDNAVVLTWGDPTTIEKTEGTVNQGFTFEGYNVWEYRSVSDDKPILLGTYDLADGVTVISDTVYDASSGLNMPTVLQKGTDNGIIHSIKITSSKVTGRNLVNGTRYFFAVTPYSYNANPPAAAGTHSLQTAATVLTVTPQAPAPGTRLTQSYGDTLKVTFGGAPADGRIVPLVVDPTKLTGHTYKVSFENDANGNTTWSLKDSTANKTVLSGQPNQAGNEDYAVVDGLLVKVIGPPPGMKQNDVNSTENTAEWGWDIPSGSRRWTWNGANASGYPLEGFEGAMGSAPNFWGSTIGNDALHNVLLKLAATDANGDLLNAADTTASYGYRFMRGCQNPPAQPSFAPFIKNTSASYAFQDYTKGVPLAAYDMETTPPTRLAVAFLENNVAAGLVDGKYWPPYYPSHDNSATSSPREWLFIMSTPYTGATADPAITALNLGNDLLPLMWVSIADRRSSTTAYAAGDEFAIFANHIFTPANYAVFTTSQPTVGNTAYAKEDVKNINVFPNPYMGFNPQETNRYYRFVTFTHLPSKATIRIFNLAGVLIRTIQKNGTEQFLQWDLNNERGFPVSAGMYVVHIDMPDLGTTKVLKLGVVPEQQYLDRW